MDSNEIAASNSKQMRDKICSPITTITELYEHVDKLPKWTERIVDLQERSRTVIANINSTCHRLTSDIIHTQRYDANLIPRTLICHDMKNGYLADRFVDGVNYGNGYTFYRWAQIDIFVYFSHHFITIPPLAWINLAHTNGVQILGTFITEWDEGKKLCETFLKDIETMRLFVHALVDLTAAYKLDGWLINIENNLDNTSMLLEFLRYLTQQLHIKRSGSLIIWYDSVIINGKLEWQNELNLKNRQFFDVCDGIFLNYTWKETNIERTANIAQHRVTDVYVGIDVFGRNSFGGGKLNCYKAAEVARSHNMSLAIFAQGWTHETLELEPSYTFFERFLHRDNLLWRSLWPYLYTHPINKCFETNFNLGANKTDYNLLHQETQLSRFLHDNTRSNTEFSVPPLTDQCNCLQLNLEDFGTFCKLTKNHNRNIFSHSLFLCDIEVNGDVAIYISTKADRNENIDLINLNLLVQNNGTFQKILCSAAPREKCENNLSVLVINPTTNDEIKNYFQIKEDITSNTSIRYYKIPFTNKARILEISAELIGNVNNIIICGFGIKMMKNI